MPLRTADSEEVCLSALARLEVDGGRRIVRSRARMIGEDPTSPLLIAEEEVPREVLSSGGATRVPAGTTAGCWCGRHIGSRSFAERGPAACPSIR